MSKSVCSILGDILTSSHNIMAFTAQGTKRVVQSETKSPKSIYLPEPPPLTPTLQRYALDTGTLQKINEAYIKRARELRDTAAVAIAQATTALSPIPGLSDSSSDERVTAIFTQVYLNTLRRWIEDIETAVSNASPGSRWKGAMTEGKSKPFNYDYVPLLEHFFDETPFPSHADKALLAKKSGMTYRQIHVWFQNRRSRTKKEGKEIRKKSSAQGATLPVDCSCTRMKQYINGRGQPSSVAGKRTPSSDFSFAQRAGTRDKLLGCPAPPHAFPAPYPPSCSYDPFPTNSGSFSSHYWLRSPSTTTRTTAVDVDALVDQFSRLNVKDSRGAATQNSGSRELSSVTLAFTTRPLPAPLPSFVSSESRPPLKRYPPLPTIPAPRSRYYVFDSPRPEARPLALLSLTTSRVAKANSKFKSIRNIAPLPRRIPRSFDNVYRAVSPVSDTSAISSEGSPRSVSSSSDTMYSAPDFSHTHHHVVSAY